MAHGTGLISVVVPTYNCAPHLQASIRSALAQTHQAIELLVVDDKSTDNTLQIARAAAASDHRVRLLPGRRNQGAAAARNRGIQEARGEYIALLDGDDLWLPDKLEKQLAFVRHTGCDLCYTAFSLVDGSGNPVRGAGHVPESAHYEQLLHNNFIGCSTVLCRADIMRRHPFQTGYFHEDYVLWLELSRAGYCLRGLDESLVRYRVHEGNRSGNKARAARNRWKIYRGFLGLSRAESLSVFLKYAVSGIRKTWYDR